jgi:hypothetical protein
LTNSINEYESVEALVVNKRITVPGDDKRPCIVGGNQRYHIMRKLGYKEVPVKWVDLDETKEEALMLFLNNTEGGQGTWTLDVKKMIDDLNEKDLGLVDSLRLFKIDSAGDALDEAEVESAKEEGPELPALELSPYEHLDVAIILFKDVRDWNQFASTMKLEKVNASPVGRRKIGLMRGMESSDFFRRLKDAGWTPPPEAK